MLSYFAGGWVVNIGITPHQFWKQNYPRIKEQGKVIILLTALLNGEQVISTDKQWDNQKEQFRQVCNNKAVCPICGEPIIGKFGPIMIHHFAHRDNSDCPGNHDSEEHMSGRNL